MDRSVASPGPPQFDADSLIGMTPARARIQVKAAGGHLVRVMIEDGVALDFARSPGRVRVLVENNRIVRVL